MKKKAIKKNQKITKKVNIKRKKKKKTDKRKTKN